MKNRVIAGFIIVAIVSAFFGGAVFATYSPMIHAITCDECGTSSGQAVLYNYHGQTLCDACIDAK